ncbi:polyprenyl synthetase family protein [bacterium]|nr:polyprenyl synthetase family protein [bacterium]
MPREKEPPKILHSAMRYSVFAGGKRLRPILAVLSFKRLGGEGDFIYTPACALELIHTYSLIHDDLPCMDNDDLRRGKPTSHKVFGEAMAILVGDALHAIAFELMARAGDVRVISDVARAIGTQGLVGGQVFDLEAEGITPTPEILEAIHRGKTAALLATSLRMGAYIAKASDEEINKVSKYGENMGLAFQIIDDILDIVADEKALGKPIGSDAERNKATYPALFGIEKSRQIAEDLIQKAKYALGESEKNLNLFAIADFILDRAY